ncbi:hypothetical protein KDI_56180 [Dictyobacter arantiisoli]|uniref:ISKra4 family transposase n=2 Tax=Dictyobacter arantiisoli TaxID=2014874 RepID=A0A5A5TLT2_9CHLR|nr:hypothetical protein KDI_56180 [Dictyobacter arantiisoli]
MPFAKAGQEMEALLGVHVSRSTAWRHCLSVGEASLQIQDEQAHPLSVLPEEPASAKLVMSTDGAFVPLQHGQWSEVKLVAIAQVEARQDQAHQVGLSYFARMQEAPRFAELASSEIRRRGVERAEQVAAIQDGAEWVQGFVRSHRRDALRILDFAHAAQRIHAIAEVARSLGQSLEEGWVEVQCHELKMRGPHGVLQRLKELYERSGKPAEMREDLHYFRKREEQMDYPTYQQQGWPIGSGVVESGNKVVMQARMKGPGMHWKESHVNPLLVLRTSLCNDRWQEMWQGQEQRRHTQHQKQRLQRQQERTRKRQAREQLLRSLVLPPPPPDPVPAQKGLKGRTEAQKRWGRNVIRSSPSSLGSAKQ